MNKRALISSALSLSLLATTACKRSPEETTEERPAEQRDESVEAVATNEEQSQAEAVVASTGSDETSARHEPIIVDERSAERTEGHIRLQVGERELTFESCGGGLASVNDRGVGEVFCENVAFDRASALSDGTIITEASNVLVALNRDNCSTDPRFPGFTKIEAIDEPYILGRLQSGDYTVENRPTHDEILWTFGGPMGDVAWLAQPNGLVGGEELVWVIDGNGRKMHAIDTNGRHLAAVDYYRLIERRTAYAMGGAMLDDGSALLFFGGREGDRDDGAAELQVWRLRGL